MKRLLVLTVVLSACNSDNTAPPPNDLAGLDMAIPVDLSGADLIGADLAQQPCLADGAPCTMASGGAGLCSAGACIACNDPSDDSACSTAYGGSYLCLAGVCAPGDCRADGNCTAPALCGLRTPNTCETCTDDSQCLNHNASTPLCNPSTMACVSTMCTLAATSPPANTGCAGTATDVCCAATLTKGQTGTCQAGNCCADTDCGSGATCKKAGGGGNAVAGICSTCAAATLNTYYVDPTTGNDTTGTGANSAGCAFKTITRALKLLPAPALANTKILVIGPGGTNNTNLDGTEVYPVIIPANVTVSITGGGTVTAKLPANATAGFVLNGANTVFKGTDGGRFIVDGQNTTAAGAFGVGVNTGSTSNLSWLEVTRVSGDGVIVAGGATVTIGFGLWVTATGTPAGAKIPAYGGLHVTGRVAGGGAAQASTVTINLPTLGGAQPVDLSNNAQHGLLVDTLGSVNITADAGNHSVRLNQNTLANAGIFQTAGAAGLGLNTLDGVYINGSSATATVTTTHGINITVGSKVKLRNATVIGNGGDGVHITATSLAVTAPDLSTIDLGTAASKGMNKLQQSNAAGSVNLGAGICIAAVVAPAAPLQAEGNQFSAADCSTGGTPPVLTSNSPTPNCKGAVDVGVTSTSTMLSSFYDTTNCTP
jgi:hypothetical protein